MKGRTALVAQMLVESYVARTSTSLSAFCKVDTISGRLLRRLKAIINPSSIVVVASGAAAPKTERD
jgi:hypothetical protein